MIELSDLAGPGRREKLRRRARLLRLVSLALLVATVVPVGLAVALLAGAGVAVATVAVGLGALCPASLALAVYAAARVADREAGERFWLDGATLVAADGLGRQTRYDLARLPVRLHLRAFMSRTAPRPVWAVLRVGDAAVGAPAEGIALELCHPTTRALRPSADLLALAEAVDGNPDPESRAAAGRLRTLASWGSLAPLTSFQPEDIPVTPKGRAG